jgi:integrase
MPRISKSGIRGLFMDADGRRRIDLRWTDAKTGAQQRYQEKLPRGLPAAAARLRAQTVLASALGGTLVKREAGAIAKLSQAFDQYLEWIETNRPKAHRQRKSIKAKWLETVGDVAIDRLDAALLETYKLKRKAQGVAPATINKGLMVAKHMAGLAARAGWSWMSRERAAVIREVEMLTEPPGRQRPIRSQELDAIFAEFRRVDSRFARRVAQAALLTGCRLGELLTLEEGDVDLKRKLIDLSKTKQNRNHQIVITPPLVVVLKEALADAKREGAAIFVNRHGEPYTVDGFSKHFARVAERAGVPDITFHDLRRHVGTLLINEGERLEVVSKLLGHSTVAVTQRSYAHLATDATRAAFDKLGNAFSLPPTPRARATRQRKSA